MASVTRASGVVIVKSSVPGTVPRLIREPARFTCRTLWIAATAQTTRQRRRRCLVCVHKLSFGLIIPPHSTAAARFVQYVRPRAP